MSLAALASLRQQTMELLGAIQLKVKQQEDTIKKLEAELKDSQEQLRQAQAAYAEERKARSALEERIFYLEERAKQMVSFAETLSKHDLI